MEKEISISKKIKAALNYENDLKDNLKIVAEMLNEHYGVKVYFCEILGGRRWSYIAGSKNVMAPNKKIKIDSKFGFVIDDYNKLSKEKWNNIIKLVKSLK